MGNMVGPTRVAQPNKALSTDPASFLLVTIQQVDPFMLSPSLRVPERHVAVSAGEGLDTRVNSLVPLALPSRREGLLAVEAGSSDVASSALS